jgi:sugar lactone lactonase YvrE
MLTSSAASRSRRRSTPAGPVTWGYSTAEDEASFARVFDELMQAVIHTALFSGFCYTQFADTFQESNGCSTPTARRRSRSSRSAGRPAAHVSTSPAGSDRRRCAAVWFASSGLVMSACAPHLLEPPVCLWEAGALLGEGTCWSVREQALWWVDILGHRLHRYTPSNGARQTWDFDETISAVAERVGGPGLIVTLQHAFALFDPASRALRRLHEPEPTRPTNRFNDGKCDAQGRFWAGTMDFGCAAPSGALYRYRAAAADEASAGDGFGVCDLALDAGFPVTNGPTWSRDGRTLYFTDTVHGRIDAHDFDPVTGSVSNSRPWLHFAEADGRPDGMTTDAAGRIWIARWGAACVTCHDRSTATNCSASGCRRARSPTSRSADRRSTRCS